MEKKYAFRKYKKIIEIEKNNMSQQQPLILVEIDTSAHFMHYMYNAGNFVKYMTILILQREQLLNLGHEKLRKVMEKVMANDMKSHGISKASKSMCDCRAIKFIIQKCVIVQPYSSLSRGV